MVARAWKPVFVVLAILAAILVPLSSARGECLVVDLPSPVQLPDGRAFAAQELAVCTLNGGGSAFSFREIRLDGWAVGVFATHVRSVTASTSREEPFMLFDRTGSSCVMRLVAFGEPSRGSLAVYRLPQSARRAEDAARVDVLCRDRTDSDSSPVSITALRR